MKNSFEAKIYKVGINPCVDVPAAITKKMTATKGYIPASGKINDHPFQQTLVPVKDALYRLYVNGPMLKGSLTKVGDIATFSIQQYNSCRDVPMHPLLFPAHWDPKLRIPRGQVVAAASIVSPKY